MIDHDLLCRPDEFKARAMLDAYRGRRLPKIQRDKTAKKSKGWFKEVMKLTDCKGVVLDRWWGTNCDLESWESGKHLRASVFTLWHYFLSLDWKSPKTFTSTMILEITGQEGRTVAINALARQRLIAASQPSPGCRRIIYYAWRSPQKSDQVKKTICRKALKFISPEGESYPLIEPVTVFAKRHNLNPRKIQKILDGELRSHQGWHL